MLVIADTAVLDTLPARQFRAAKVDGGLLVGRRFETHERLDRADEPVLLAATIVGKLLRSGHTRVL